jgi:ATP-dependent RNA helicase RhlE
MGPDPERPPRESCGDAKARPIILQQTKTGRSAAGFDRFDLRSELRRAVRDAGFTDTRPIQDGALPPALQGRDVLGLAQTGTGKTAAFVLPILQRLLGGRKPGPRALVVAPTRELAAQVHAEFERLAVHTPLKSTAVFGGVPIARQMRALRAGADIVVACPGRLLDLLSQRALRLDRVEVLVLDEADHMFDMGFLPDVRRILRELPRQRQNLLFSASMPREIRRLADNVLQRPAVIELANSRPAETIAHSLYALSEGEKVGALRRLVDADGFRSAIVFLRTKRRAKRLAERLDDLGQRAVALQGNMSQAQRERALRGFRDGRYDVLVATDVAARGLDIAGVSHVVNFDVPATPDAYTHRIGRTGRSEQVGTAFTFVTPTDDKALRAIEKHLGSPIERRRVAELGPLEHGTIHRGKPRGKAPRQARGKARPPAKRKGTRTRVVRARPAPAQPGPARPASSKPAAAFGVGVHDAAAPKKAETRDGEPQRPRRRRRRRAPVRCSA